MKRFLSCCQVRPCLNLFLCVAMVLAMLQTTPMPAQAAKTSAGSISDITLSPASIRPGGTVMVTAYALTPGTSYPVGLVNGASLANPVSVTANARGQAAVRVTIPLETAPGSHKVGVGVYSGGFFERETALTVLSAISISLDKSQAQPGESVSYTLGNLASGTLQLTFAGLPVGQFQTTASTATGAFTVPDPGVAGTVKFRVTLVSSLTGAVAGATEANFTLNPAASEAQPVLSSLVISPNPVMPGQEFTIEGTLWPLPEGWSSTTIKDVQVSAAGGSGFMVNLQDNLEAYYASDAGAMMEAFNPLTGSFRLRGRAPAVENGSPISMRHDMSAGVKFLYNNGQSYAQLPAGGPLLVTMTIQTTDAGGNPVGGVEISVTDFTPIGKNTTRKEAAQFKHESPLGSMDELAANMRASYFCHHAPATAALTGKALVSLEVENLVVNPLDEMMESELFNDSAEVVLDQVIADAGSITTFPPAGWSADEWSWIRILADGRRNNLSYYVPGDPWQTGEKIRIYGKYFWLNKTSNSLYDENGTLVGNNLVIPFEAIPADAVGPAMSITLSEGVDMGVDPQLKGRVYTGFYDFSSIPGLVFGLPNINLVYAFDLAYGDPGTTTVFIDGIQVTSVSHDAGGSPGAPICASKDASSPQAVQGTANEYTIPLSFFKTYTPGQHTITVRIDLQGGGLVTRRLAFRVNPLPNWFASDQNTGRSVMYEDGAYKFKARALDPATAAWGAGEGEGNGASITLPETGTLTNQAKASVFITQVIRPTANGEETSALHDVQAKDTRTMSNKATSQTPDQTQNPVDPLAITIDQEFELAQISIPIFITAFEDPFGGVIVNGTAGATVAAGAKVSLEGEISPSKVVLTMKPSAIVKMGIWLNINILYGVLAQARMAVYPELSLAMDVTFTTLEKPPFKVNHVCFGYGMDIYYYFGFACIPLLGCLADHEGTVPVFHGTLPNPCATCDLKPYGPEPANDAAALLAAGGPETAEAALTHDLNGRTVGVFQTGTHRILNVRTLSEGEWGAPAVINTSETGGNNPAITTLNAHQSLVAWTASGYASSTIASHSMAEVAVSQYIEYTLVTDGAASSPAELTTPFSGDGQVSLGSCPGSTSGCPADGSALAAWQRMKNSDPYKGGTRIYYSTYQSSAWTGLAAIPVPATTTSDAQAQVFYRGTQAMIAFVRDADGSGFTTDDRRLYFYTPGQPAAELVSNIPAGIIEFSVEVDSDGVPQIAFTRAEAGTALLDNRHTLYSAAGSCNGACAWTVTKQLDAHGREIYAESPTLTLDPQNHGRVVYRALGMGADGLGDFRAYPEDSIGVVNQTGELAVLSLNGSGKNPVYLTHNGAVNWETEAAYDWQSGTLVSLAVQTASLAQDPRQSADRQTTRSLDAASPIVFSIQSSQPNFVINEITASSHYFIGPAAKTITVTLRNDGGDWSMTDGQALTVAAAWDAPYGAGLPTGTVTLTELLSGEISSVTLELTPPPSPDINHTLYLSIIPPANSPETSLSDNTLSIGMGGLPTLQNVHLMGEHGNAAPMITWQKSDDQRVNGYHIYRAEGSGSLKIVGVTKETFWLDTNVNFDTLYTYAVSAYSADGESPLSIITAIQPQRFRLLFPLVMK